MTADEFSASLAGDAPPQQLAPVARALWLAGKGDWDGAHALVGDLETRAAAAVHAHLHRQEGDLDNARYWYGRAQRDVARGPLEEEWRALVAEIATENRVDGRDR
jgi:hypothetical protein